MNRVLITDGHWRKTLAATRALGEKGIAVTVGETSIFATSLFSKYCARRLVYPSPKRNPDKFIAAIITELNRFRYDAILPMEETTMLVLSQHKEKIEKYTNLPILNYEMLNFARNKARVIKHAQSIGIPCPKTYFIENIKEVEQISNSLPYPVIIKPQISSGSFGIRKVASKENLMTDYLQIHNKFPYPLIQEYIPDGGAFGVSLLFNRQSQLRAVFTHKRLREYPVKGGPSTLRRGIRRYDIEDLALKLMKSLLWYGVTMVEFRVDKRDGIPKLMEINPRFWGSLQLAISSGVNFPYLLYKIACSGDTEGVFEYKTGAQCRWLLFGDILHFLSNRKRFSLEPGFFKFFGRNTSYDICSTADIKPILGRILSGITLLYDPDMKKILKKR